MTGQGRAGHSSSGGMASPLSSDGHLKRDAPVAEDIGSTASDSLTILYSRTGVLTKRVSAAREGWRVVPFSAGRWFSVHTRRARCFDELVDTLERVSLASRCAVIRGQLLPGVDLRRCRRLSDRVEHGDAVTFASCARLWIGIDVDGLEEPPGCTFAAEPEDGVEHAVLQLPDPFHDVSCWWQATGSAGLRPGIRCRLWFWLSRPVSDAEAKGWLAGCPVDGSLFRAVALHYTAPPILAPGTPQPVVRRSGVRQGLGHTVEVPALLPATPGIAACPVQLDGEELSSADLAALAAAVRRSPTARAIWTGERAYPDRSRGHFALAATLARGGCTDPDTLHRVLLAYDRRQGNDTGKILRADYARRTIAAALGAECRP